MVRQRAARAAMVVLLVLSLTAAEAGE